METFADGCETGVSIEPLVLDESGAAEAIVLAISDENGEVDKFPDLGHSITQRAGILGICCSISILRSD